MCVVRCPHAIPTILPAHSPLIILGGITVFAPLIDGGTTHLPVLIIRLSLLLTMTAWAIISVRSGRVTLLSSRLFLTAVIFVGWAVCSVIRSPYTASSLQWLLSICSYALMWFLVVHLVACPRQVRWLVMVILGMGLFEAVVGISQFVWLGQSRATGTFFNPNFFASYEVAAFAVAFGLLCFLRPREGGGRWESALLWLTAGLSALAFILAQSRGALLAFVTAVSFVGFYRFGRVFLGILVLCFLTGALIPNPLQHRVLTIGKQDPFAYTRLDIWKSSLQRIADSPWGVGMGMYKYLSFRYRFPVEDAIARYGKRAESAHNEYLQMAVELGVAGLVIFLVGMGVLAMDIRETLTLGLDPWEKGVVVGLTGGILGVIAHGAVDAVFHEPALALLICLFTGLILVLRRVRSPGSLAVLEIPVPYHPARIIPLVVVLATVLGLLVVRPAAAWYAFDRGEHEMTVGRVDRALDWYRWAMHIDPGTSLYHDAVAFTQVRLYQQSGERRWLYGAVSELMVSLELNPLDGRLANRLGGLFVQLAGSADTKTEREALLKEAATYYEQAMRLDPYVPFNYLELGKLRWAQGRLDEARSLFRQATSYEPNFLPARVQLAELVLSLGQKKIAAVEYAEILKIKDRYRGRTLNSLERQYLEIDDEHLKRSLDLESGP